MKHQSIAAEHDGAGTDSREPDGHSIRCRGVPLAAAHSAGGCRMKRDMILEARHRACPYSTIAHMHYLRREQPMQARRPT